MGLIDLLDKHALVTGGSRGIGAATAGLLAEAGANVAVVYRNREDDARAVLDDLHARGPGKTMMIQADLSTRTGCEDAVLRTVTELGGLDIFVANAGVWPAENVGVRDMDDDRWRRTLSVNLDSVFYGTRAALRVIRPHGRIVIVSSTASQRGESYHADYAATKGAINAFVKSVAVEAAPHATVNAVAPGWVDTEMSEQPYQRDGGGGRVEIESRIPMGRVATALEIAGPIVFLCSELAGHVTGEILNVNGGSVLCG